MSSDLDIVSKVLKKLKISDNREVAVTKVIKFKKSSSSLATDAIDKSKKKSIKSTVNRHHIQEECFFYCLNIIFIVIVLVVVCRFLFFIVISIVALFTRYFSCLWLF